MYIWCELKTTYMVMIDNIEANSVLKRHLDFYRLEVPKFMIGDSISLYKNAKKIFMGKIITASWDSTYDEYLESTTLRVIKKFKYSREDPWWSVIQDDNGTEVYIIDECLTKPFIPAKEMYSPKRIKKTI